MGTETEVQIIPPSKYVDIPEAKEIVKCSEATLRRKLTNGELTRYKFGRRTLLLRAELLGQVKRA